MSSSMDEDEKRAFRAKLEGWGETHVREEHGRARWGELGTHAEAAVADAWLHEKEAERLEAHRREALGQTDELVEHAKETNRLADEANEKAKEANETAREANRLAENANATAAKASDTASNSTKYARETRLAAVGALLLSALAFAKSMGWI